MLEKVAKNNSNIQGMAFIINTKDPFLLSIPTKGKLCMASFIQEEGILMFKYSDLKELVLKAFEVGSWK